MTNNDVLKSIRYIFNFSDTDMIDIFKLADLTVSRELVCQWLKKDDDNSFKKCLDIELGTFLNGLINKNRGKKEGAQVPADKRINNNIILRKLKIAMDLKSDGVVELLDLADFKISNHELSAFFRKPDHKNFRTCKSQVLRNFLKGLRLKHRPGELKNNELKW